MTTITRHPQYFSVVGDVAECAQRTMPQALPRLVKAVQIVLAGGVQPSSVTPGGWRVASQSQADGSYEVADAACTCEDWRQHQGETPPYACKHRLAVWLSRRVAGRLAEIAPAYTSLPTDGCWQPVDADQTPCHAVGRTCTHTTPIPASQAAQTVSDMEVLTLTPSIVHIHGKPFIHYAGLLQLAHSRGLTELSAEIAVHIEGVLAIAKATAVFADGRRFSESADATPGNVNAKIKPHFVRMALTRAKARALRDALNIGMTALEELGE